MHLTVSTFDVDKFRIYMSDGGQAGAPFLGLKRSDIPLFLVFFFSRRGPVLLQAPPSPCLPHLGSPVAAAASLLCFVPLPGGGKKQLIFSNIILFFDPKKTSRVFLSTAAYITHGAHPGKEGRAGTQPRCA